MKILYAVQATGNGHIARAIELMPFLKQYGEVDVFLSGSNSHLSPALPIKYRSEGLSLFYGNSGSLDYYKIWQQLKITRVWQTARQLPVEQYDLVINDFECITALACKLKGVKSIQFGHQASFQSAQTPRPAVKDTMGEWILKHYAPATQYVGLHFQPYDSFIYSPILKETVLQATPENHGHVTVYLAHYSDQVVLKTLQQCADVRFEVFSKKAKTIEQFGNVTLMPIGNEAFTQSMINSMGVITGAGFETPAEALYLGKKLLCLPIRGQYEQLCNAAALESFRVPVVKQITPHMSGMIYGWLASLPPKKLTLTHQTSEVISIMMKQGMNQRNKPRFSSKTYQHDAQMPAFG